jgi:hypothetical protein
MPGAELAWFVAQREPDVLEEYITSIFRVED